MTRPTGHVGVKYLLEYMPYHQKWLHSHNSLCPPFSFFFLLFFLKASSFKRLGRSNVRMMKGLQPGSLVVFPHILPFLRLETLLSVGESKNNL